MDSKVDKFLKIFTPAMLGYLGGYYHCNYRIRKFLKEYIQ